MFLRQGLKHPARDEKSLDGKITGKIGSFRRMGTPLVYWAVLVWYSARKLVSSHLWSRLLSGRQLLCLSAHTAPRCSDALRCCVGGESESQPWPDCFRVLPS